MRNYMEQLPRYDPELFRTVKVWERRAVMKFKTSFTMMLFLNIVVNGYLYRNLTWDYFFVSQQRDGSYIVMIGVQKDLLSNRMIFKMYEA